LHATRLQLALLAMKLQTWPFPGRIALREHAFCGTEWHVLDHWSYLGTAHDEDELGALAQQRAPDSLDPDVYRVLVRYFSTHGRLDWRDLSGSP
jgi:hypothetical protein